MRCQEKQLLVTPLGNTLDVSAYLSNDWACFPRGFVNLDCRPELSDIITVTCVATTEEHCNGVWGVIVFACGEVFLDVRVEFELELDLFGSELSIV